VRLDDDELLAIESKLTEFLSGDHEAQFSDRYAASVEELADDHWRRAYHQLRDEPNQFRYLNAAQLVKHYLGLRRCFGDRRATLMYAFWEPANADEHEAFRLHREEIERFASLVAGGNIHFTSIDYSSLWESWASDEPTADHVHRLRERYLINLSTEDLR
jgi:hypothetical protein